MPWTALAGLLGLVLAALLLRRSLCSIRMAEHYVAYVAVPNEDVGRSLARGLIEERLAACVNIIPRVISVYEWKEKVEEENEALLLIKTSKERLDELTAFVKRKHPYELPEVIAVPITDGSDAYLLWVQSQVNKPKILSDQKTD